MRGIDLLRLRYPLHVQRIAEAIHVQAINDSDDDYRVTWFLYDQEVDPAYPILASAFYWAETAEGHEYWAALARAEANYAGFTYD